MKDSGQNNQSNQLKVSDSRSDLDNFVLDKGIFSNIFDKDIRRVYIYKKSERLAKALYLIAPAFKNAHALRDKVQRISVELVDASILPPLAARDALSRELLALSSILSIARTSGLLSPMNAELIAKEAHLLLKEIAAYEEPKLSFEDMPSLATLAKTSVSVKATHRAEPTRVALHTVSATPKETKGHPQGHTGSKKDKGGRREAILSVLRSKGPSYIKDLSTVIRDVSEKTIQRELQNLVLEGMVSREGERRWTTYTLVRSAVSE